MWSTAADGLPGGHCWRFQSGGIELNNQTGVPDAMHEEVSTAEACAAPEGAAEHEKAGQLERDATGERETKGER